MLSVSWWHLTGCMGEKISLRQETLKIQLSYFSLMSRGHCGLGHRCASAPGDKGTHLPLQAAVELQQALVLPWSFYPVRLQAQLECGGHTDPVRIGEPD